MQDVAANERYFAMTTPHCIGFPGKNCLISAASSNHDDFSINGSGIGIEAFAELG